MERSLKIKAAKKSRSNDMAYAISATHTQREREREKERERERWTGHVEANFGCAFFIIIIIIL